MLVQNFLSKHDPEKLREALADYSRQQEEQKRIAREAPRKDFISAAKKAGFSSKQAIFMWEHLSLAGHSHWDGRIG